MTAPLRLRVGMFDVDADFKNARQRAGLTVQEASELLRVSDRTVRNWEAGRCAVPYSAFAVVCLYGGFELPWESWRGWVLVGDALYSPEGLKFAPHEMSWWSLTVLQARSWREQHGVALGSPVDTVSAQPLRHHGAAPQGGSPGDPAPEGPAQREGPAMGRASELPPSAVVPLRATRTPQEELMAVSAADGRARSVERVLEPRQQRRAVG